MSNNNSSINKIVKEIEIKKLILDEIIKRFQYKEGLYQYYTKNNEEIAKASALLANPTEFNKILQ